MPGHPGIRLGAGVQADALASRTKTCTTRDCVGGDSVWRDDPMRVTGGPFATFDMRWIGVGIGGIIPMAGEGNVEFIPDPHSHYRVRLGPTDFLFGSAELFNGSPRLSGGGPLAIGLGGRVYGTDLWGGSTPHGPMARVGRYFGPLRLEFVGCYANREVQLDEQEGTREFVIPDWSLSAKVGLRVR